MPREIALHVLEKAVETLWFGIDEHHRQFLSGYRIESEVFAHSGDFVGLEDNGTGSKDLVIYLKNINQRSRADGDFNWRSELAKQVRQQVRMSSIPENEDGLRGRGSSVSGVDEPRSSYVSVIDGWTGTIPPSSPSASPRPSMSNQEERQKRSVFGASLRWFFRALTAPARAAFRKRTVSGPLGTLGFMGWRVVTIGGYLVIVVGLVYLFWSFASSWRAAAGARASFDQPASGEVAQESEVTGPSWSALLEGDVFSGEGERIVLSGPNHAFIEIMPSPVPMDAGIEDVAMLCARGDQGIAMGGGNGLEYIDVRYEESNLSWISRCITRRGMLFRATAPEESFSRDHVGSWLLLAILNHRWHSESESTVGANDG